MINTVLNNIFRFLILIFLQVFLINWLFDFSNYIRPYIYIIAIILLPFEIPLWLLLISSFLSGFFVGLLPTNDVSVAGIHSAACLVIAFARPYILKLLIKRDKTEYKKSPSIKYYGFLWFLRYIAIMIFIFNATLFSFETFKDNFDFFSLIIRIAGSFIVTVLLTIAVFMLSTDSKKKKESNYRNF